MLARTPIPGFWLLIWALLWSFSLQLDTFSFVNPPSDQSTIPNPVYTVGDPIDIEWVGPNDFVSVRLVHYLADKDLDEFVYVFDNVTNLDGHYTWIIDLGSMNLTASSTFFFNIFIEGETSPRALTHNITLTNTTTSITSTMSSATTTATHTHRTSAINTAATTTSLPTKTGASSSPTASSSGLSAGAKAGIGVGIAVGAIALVAAGALLWRRRSAGKNMADGVVAGQAPPQSYEPVSQNTYSEYYKPRGVPPELSEAPTSQPPSELTGSGPERHELADTSRQ
ncbi:hypothetical protein BGW36DRAFT_381960 [Talaromyces proteolyticus]|uniref:Mid2 domain-containing protein n=1 Tax=Talaromyces proteolyticus TaxID=1131652 RepID=A0AAD4PYV5_9EURO|nr:uncharacterized protein BGW36DRAFT_381960 [Talaromyces proteolyticus]KAH8695024.1 hypothetical protein BGW36DRAFT_381960 [Talaromyces proteolyticus]